MNPEDMKPAILMLVEGFCHQAGVPEEIFNGTANLIKLIYGQHTYELFIMLVDINTSGMYCFTLLKQSEAFLRMLREA